MGALMTSQVTKRLHDVNKPRVNETKNTNTAWILQYKKKLSESLGCMCTLADVLLHVKMDWL